MKVISTHSLWNGKGPNSRVLGSVAFSRMYFVLLLLMQFAPEKLT